MKIGAHVRLIKSLRYAEMRPELNTAVGVVCNSETRDGEERISVNYAEFSFLAEDVPAACFEEAAEE